MNGGSEGQGEFEYEGSLEGESWEDGLVSRDFSEDIVRPIPDVAAVVTFFCPFVPSFTSGLCFLVLTR